MKHPYQSANSPYAKFVRQESETFHQATLLMPEDKHLIAWALFTFWRSLTPDAFWKAQEAPNRFISDWKEKIFFGENNQGQLALAESAWLDLQGLFDINSRQLILNVLNGLEASSGPIRFPSFKELELYLQSIGGSIALISAQILFADEVDSGSIDFLEPIYYLGSGLLWWKLLQNTAYLVQEGRLFIPLEDLSAYKCTEEDLLAEIRNPGLEELTKFQLQKVADSLKFAKKSSVLYPKGLKEALTFISNHFLDEISVTLRSGWVLSSKDLPNQKANRSGWFISGITKFQKKNTVR
jgi:hypothetical protein